MKAQLLGAQIHWRHRTRACPMTEVASNEGRIGMKYYYGGVIVESMVDAEQFRRHTPWEVRPWTTTVEQLLTPLLEAVFVEKTGVRNRTYVLSILN